MPSVSTKKDLSYLKPLELCPKKTTLALSITALTILTFGLIVLKSTSLLIIIEPGEQLKLFFQFTFLLACTTALWKHAME